MDSDWSNVEWIDERSAAAAMAVARGARSVRDVARVLDVSLEPAHRALTMAVEDGLLSCGRTASGEVLPRTWRLAVGVAYVIVPPSPVLVVHDALTGDTSGAPSR